ncbi:alpha/beta hydrolase [Streptomyces sp. ID01-12c]|uniref:alpha/beta fold hydrolase n=1 Tax=Streptomyces caniscabiei TaxID=2746961 RepID=UPI00177B9665|nr:alpha/beta hydrolase [Streptomyces caniscabiei]MBD9701787.1 alpha/beta hydrolase [Streptomyces caniscabiei]MDX3728611.1 alpha/beta hydrolase [Streptomyces caniscabiei]
MRRLWGCLILCVAVVAGLVVHDARDSAAAGRDESSHAYGPHPRQTLDAYWNAAGEEGGRKQPGLVILHGGHRYEDTGWATWSRTFADAGYAVFAVDHRLNFDAPWPAQRTDALSALDWIRAHAADFDVDADRLVLLGSSSGGQIATAVATYGSGGSRVDGVVALSPVNDPYRAWRDGNAGDATVRQRRLRDNATLLARCHPDPADDSGSAHPGCRDTWRDMVVRHRASGGDDAPMFLLHSEDDFVPVRHSLDLEAAEENDHNMPPNGVTVEAVAGSAHGGALLKEPGVADRVMGWIAERTH